MRPKIVVGAENRKLAAGLKALGEAIVDLVLEDGVLRTPATYFVERGLPLGVEFECFWRIDERLAGPGMTNVDDVRMAIAISIGYLEAEGSEPASVIVLFQIHPKLVRAKSHIEIIVDE